MPPPEVILLQLWYSFGIYRLGRRYNMALTAEQQVSPFWDHASLWQSDISTMAKNTLCNASWR